MLVREAPKERAMPGERIIFELSFKSLFNSLPEALQPEVARRWKTLGVDLDKLLPGYPVQTWWQAVQLVAGLLEGSPSERLRSLGRTLTEGFTQSRMGRATAPLARLMGTRRTLLRSPITFRSGNNYLQSVIELADDQRVKLRVNDVSPIADLLAGSIEALVTFTGGFHPEVEITVGADETAYDIRWESTERTAE
jgi:uncharacterized protein (TIGR02265 family)